MKFILTLTAALLLALPPAPAAAQSPDFCAVLKRVIAEQPKDFAPLRTRRFYKSTDEWEVRLPLPDMQYCRIAAGLKNYNCWMSGMPVALTNIAAERLKTEVAACIGLPTAPEKTEDLPDTSRTTIAWQAGTARVEIVKRIGKQKPPKNSVFIRVD